MELLERKMQETSSSEHVSAKLQRIAKLAEQDVTMVLVTLAHHIDVEFLKEAFRRTRRDGAPGETAYEPIFSKRSYGFRPGRSARQASQALWKTLTRMGGGWVIEADIESFFDTLDHHKLRKTLVGNHPGPPGEGRAREEPASLEVPVLRET